MVVNGVDHGGQSGSGLEDVVYIPLCQFDGNRSSGSQQADLCLVLTCAVVLVHRIGASGHPVKLEGVPYTGIEHDVVEVDVLAACCSEVLAEHASLHNQHLLLDVLSGGSGRL